MKRFIAGADRGQSTLFPERLEDWVGEDNPVRVVDVFVDELDLGGLGFGSISCTTVMDRRLSGGHNSPDNSSARRLFTNADDSLAGSVLPVAGRRTLPIADHWDDNGDVAQKCPCAANILAR
jgi:hypothetical protein